MFGWIYAGWSFRSLEEALHLYDHILLQGAHDLKTPLALLRLEISRLSREASTARIKAALRRLEQLADDILFLAEGRTPEPSIRKIPLKQRLQELLELFREEMRIRHLEVEHTFEGDLVVDTDPQALDRLLVNLLDNAVRYSPEGATLRIHLTPPVLTLENPVGVPNPLDEGLGWAVIRTVANRYGWGIHRTVSRGIHRVEIRFPI
jgi:signal transduction histidine kinase